MSNTVLNISLAAKDSPTVNITINEAGSVKGTGSVSPIIKFIASGESGPQGAQGPQGTIAGSDVVTESNIQDGAVTTAKLDDNSVNADKLAPNSVYGSAIPDYAITTSKLGNDSVTSDKIADDAITSAHIAPNAINEELIESGIITRTSIADKTIDSSKIQNNTLVKENFQLGTIDGTVIVNNLTLTGVLTTNGYKNLGASPGVYEGPDDNEMHLKFHQNLEFVNTSGTVVAGLDQNGNLTLSGTVDGVDLSTDVAANTAKAGYPTSDSTKVGYLTITQNLDLDTMKSKLDGVEANATADQTAAEVRTLVDLAFDSQVFTDADHTKLDGIEVGATADQTAEEIQDIAGPLVATGGTKTGIAITYDDDNGNMDFVVDHDAATNFVAEEHYRWDNDIQSTATINHLNLSSDTPGETEVLVMNDGDAVWGHGEKIHIQVRNDEGSTISAGQPLYSKGEIGGSNRILVGVCDANDSAKMPCIGIAHSEMNTTSTKDNFAVVSGIYNTNISGFISLAVGDNLYIQDNGSLSQTKPTGESSLIQNVGIVLKTNGSTCQGMLVSAIGRTNDVPNLDSGNIFLGNASNVAQTTTVAAAIEGAGNITIDGDLKLDGNTIKSSAGTVMIDTSNSVLKAPENFFTNTVSGYDNTDFELKAGGNISFTLDDDDNETGQSFSFRDGGAYGVSTEIANLDQSGNLQIDGDLTVSGNEIKDNDGTTCITFDSAGDTTISNKLTVTDLEITDDLTLGDDVNINATGILYLAGAGNGEYITSSAPNSISVVAVSKIILDADTDVEGNLEVDEAVRTNLLGSRTDVNMTVSSKGSLDFVVDSDNNETSQKFTFNNGGSGGVTEIASIDESGNLQLDGGASIRSTRNTEVVEIADFQLVSDSFIQMSAAGDTDDHRLGLKLKHNADTYGFTIQSQDGVDSLHGLNVLRHEDSSGGTSALFIERDNGDVGVGNTAPTVKLDVTGDIKASGSIVGKQKQVYTMNFYDDIGTTEHYLSWQDQYEYSTNTYTDPDIKMTAPYNGRVVSVSVRQGSVGNTVTRTFKVYKTSPGFQQPTSMQESEAISVSSSDDYIGHHFVFSDAEHWEAGDTVILSVQDSADMNGSQNYYVSVVVEWDLNQPIATASGTIT